MSKSAVTKLLQSSTRKAPIIQIPARSFVCQHQSLSTLAAPSQLRPRVRVLPISRLFSTSRQWRKGLTPGSANPSPKPPESTPIKASAPAEITIDQYHELSDVYLNSLVEQLEQLQEEREEVDCEYTSGVLTLAFPPNGTYVINKQPPNKQIWLSSPITGPKRYDYVLLDEGQDSKEGSGRGDWIYLRDHSTLTSLIKEEIGVDMAGIYEASS